MNLNIEVGLEIKVDNSDIRRWMQEVTTKIDELDALFDNPPVVRIISEEK